MTYILAIEDGWGKYSVPGDEKLRLKSNRLGDFAIPILDFWFTPVRPGDPFRGNIKVVKLNVPPAKLELKPSEYGQELKRGQFSTLSIVELQGLQNKVGDFVRSGMHEASARRKVIPVLVS